MGVDVLTETVIERPRKKIVAPLMASAMRRANRKDLAKLKSVLERG